MRRSHLLRSRAGLLLGAGFLLCIGAAAQAQAPAAQAEQAAAPSAAPAVAPSAAPAAAAPSAAAQAAPPSEAPGAAATVGEAHPAAAAPSAEAPAGVEAHPIAAGEAQPHAAEAGHQTEQHAGDSSVHAIPSGHGGEPAHGAAAHGEGHGEGHHGPVIENWWSWDYGPGKAHHNPPFGFALINFVVFLGLMSRLAGKPFREFLSTRHLSVKKALDEAAAVQARAQEELSRYEAQIKKIDSEVNEMLAQVRRDAEAERARIVAAAEAQADQLRRDAESQIQVELDRARHELRRATVEAALAAATQILKNQVNESDQRRLVDDFVSRMEGLAGKEAAARTSQGRVQS